ncbi:hypothetical protein K439DRAFT_1634966 [Ramaria rubella]|nr:hypothetical protein K439DRAFT_1634966 [Ramaria rubella]
MACRFALLFPSKCLSLCLASVPADVPLDWTPKAFMDLIQIWCFPPDLETFEQALLEMSHFQFAGQISTALEDEVTEFWSINMPPRKRRAVVELTIGRCPPTDKEYSQITVPTLLLTGDRSVAHPVKEAAKTNEKIKDSQLYVIKGAPENFTILPHFTSISHRVYASFLARQPPPPPFTPSRPDLKKVAKEALARLAELREDPSIASRDPSTTLSFSMWSPETVAANQGFLDQMAADENTAFLPTDSKGQPIRKFSARHDDQWTWAGFSVKPESMETVKGISIRSS